MNPPFLRSGSLPSKSLPAFFAFGAPLCAFAAVMLVAFAFAFAGLVGTSVIIGLIAFAAPLGPALEGRKLLIRGFDLLHQASAANARGDTATAKAASLRVLETVYRADFRAAAIFQLACASEGTEGSEDAAHLFLLARATLPSGLKTAAVRRFGALVGARAAINWAAIDRLREARDSLLEAQADLAAYHGGLFSNATPYGHGRLDVVLNELDGRCRPAPLVSLASAFVALRGGDRQAAMEIVKRDGHGIAAALAPKDRALLELVSREASAQLVDAS